MYVSDLLEEVLVKMTREHLFSDCQGRRDGREISIACVDFMQLRVVEMLEDEDRLYIHAYLRLRASTKLVDGKDLPAR